MKSRRSSLVRVGVFALSLLSAVLAGCDGSPTNVPPPEPDLGRPPKQDTYDPAQDRYTLTIIGSSSFTLKPSEQATLRVGYMKNETNLVGKAIEFKFQGDARDSAMSTFVAITDNVGAAQTTLTAATTQVTYQVVATAPMAAPVTFYITVVSPPAPTPRLAAGSVLSLTSSFDVQTQFTGTKLGDVLNVLNEMSNHPDDPGRYIVDITFQEAFKSLDPNVQSLMKSIVQPMLYGPVQSLLMNWIPNIVTQVKKIAADLSTVARKFQMTSSLISATEQPVDKPITVSHKVESIAWTLDGLTKAYTFQQLGLKQPQVDNVQVTVANLTAMAIAEHTFTMQFGSFILVALDQFIIPMINPKANDFAGLLGTWVNCAEVGKTINDKASTSIGINLGQGFWQSACDAALKAVGIVVENQITKINLDTTTISIEGTCQATDQNADAFIDTLSGGLWTGAFTLAGSAAAITGPTNNFTGTRIK